MIACAGHFPFGAAGGVAAFLGAGWAVPEADFIWTAGARSELTLPLPGGTETLSLEMGVSPLICPPVLPRQRLIVTANGVAVADEVFGVECSMGWDIPAVALAGRESLHLVLECPLAASPASLGIGPDPRVVGVAVHEILLLQGQDSAPCDRRALAPLQDGGSLPLRVHSATGLDIAELAGYFESLGHDCEFGLAQRQMGAERLGLLRFAGIPPRRLPWGLDRDFEGLGAPGNLSLATEDDGPEAEYMLHDSAYGMVMHTGQSRASIAGKTLLARAGRHLDFLARKLMEDARLGQKIFVFNHPGLQAISQIRPLLNVLRSHGRNTLLFVRDDGQAPAGTVRREEADLLLGWVDALGWDRAGHRLDLPAWVSVCANAYVLWREQGGAA